MILIFLAYLLSDGKAIHHINSIYYTNRTKTTLIYSRPHLTKFVIIHCHSLRPIYIGKMGELNQEYNRNHQVSIFEILLLLVVSISVIS